MRQDLAILSQNGCCNSTCQLRPLSSRAETFLSCTATDLKKIASGCRNCAQDTPSLSPRGLSKMVQKLCVSPIFFFAKSVQNLCSHNFRAILGRGDSEVPKMLLHKFCAFFLNLDNKASCTGNKCLKSPLNAINRIRKLGKFGEPALPHSPEPPSHSPYSSKGPRHPPEFQ